VQISTDAPAPPRPLVSRREGGDGRIGRRSYLIIDLTEAAEKERRFSFTKPWPASSAEIARSDMRLGARLSRRSPRRIASAPPARH
jgi:hypothetical protein